MARSFPISLLHRIAAALALLCCATTLALAEPGRRVALVVGNGAYQNAPALPNPPNDARAVAQALRDLNFEVLEATDLDQPDLRVKLNEFGQQLEGAQVGLFFYAGHGLQVDGENYLVPIDARLQKEAQVPWQTVPLRDVLSSMEAAVPTRLVLLDACRDNPLVRQLKRGVAVNRSSSIGQGLAEVHSAVGTLIAYATGPGDVAADGDDRHSPFTAALLEHIATPGLEVRQVLGRVRDQVLKATGDQQVPWDSSSLRGEFFFKARDNASNEYRLPSQTNRISSSNLPPIGAFDERQLDLGYWESVKDSNSIEDFSLYLENYPNGIYAALAKRRISVLQALAADNKEYATSTTVGKPIDPTLFEIERRLALSTGEWQRIQQALGDLGYYKALVDGRPGNATRSAIGAWQKSMAIHVSQYLDESQRDMLLQESQKTLAAMQSQSKLEAPESEQQLVH